MKAETGGKITIAARRTGLVHDRRFTDHCTDPGHPECPARLEMLNSMLQEPDMLAHFLEITPRKAAEEELLAVHSPEHIHCLTDSEGNACTYLDADTRTSPFSHETALLAAGGLCRAIELVQAGKLDNAFALEFEPELVLVSAGFDIHVDDRLGGMRVTTKGFAALTRSIPNTADACCGGKVVMTLEGGYDLQGLQASVRAVLREMAGLQITDIEDIIAGADSKKLAVLLWRIRCIHGRYWKTLVQSLQDVSDLEPSIFERLKDTTLRIAAYLKS